MKNLSIQTVLLSLLTLTVLVTLISTIGSAFSVSKQNIINLRLEDNLAYAKKMADVTNNIVSNMQQNLIVLSAEIQPQLNNVSAISQSLQKLSQSNNFFDAAIYFDENGSILSAYPNTDHINTISASEIMKESFEDALSQPYVSSPFSLSGDLLLLLTAPVTDLDGNPKGFVGGTVHLKKYNIFSKTVGTHTFNNTGYVYVVDQDGKLIYHPKTGRINDDVSSNEVVQKVMMGKSGSQEVLNTQGVEMLAGYAYVPLTRWGIVSQIPRDSISGHNQILIQQILKNIVPFVIILLLLSLFLIKKMIQPITLLANYSRSTLKNEYQEKPIIRDVFYEIVQLKNAVFLSMDFFREKMKNLEIQSKTDPLTGLLNRRAYDLFLTELKEANRSFSLVAFDIDHFKQVNDEYGHLQGDVVLQMMASIILKEIRGADKAFRCGGEEFCLVLPDIDLDVAKLMSERIRKKIATTSTPIGKCITISMGVGYFSPSSDSLDELLEKTDKALYIAKENGRNQVVVAS